MAVMLMSIGQMWKYKTDDKHGVHASLNKHMVFSQCVWSLIICLIDHFIFDFTGNDPEHFTVYRRMNGRWAMLE